MKLIISYQPGKCQIPELSESNFTEFGIRHPSYIRQAIMTSLHNIWFSKLHTLWKLIETISFPGFIDLNCLDQILRGGGWKHPPPPVVVEQAQDFLGIPGKHGNLPYLQLHMLIHLRTIFKLVLKYHRTCGNEQWLILIFFPEQFHWCNKVLSSK